MMPHATRAYVGCVAEVDGSPEHVLVMDTHANALMGPGIAVGMSSGPSVMAITSDGT